MGGRIRGREDSFHCHSWHYRDGLAAAVAAHVAAVVADVVATAAADAAAAATAAAGYHSIHDLYLYRVITLEGDPSLS